VKFDGIAQDKPRRAWVRLTLMRAKKGPKLMSSTKIRGKTAGFRELKNFELAVVAGGLDPLPGDDGPPIIVTGSPYGVSQDWLDLTNSSIGDFFDQLSDNNYNFFQDTGDGGGGGGGVDVDIKINEDKKVEAKISEDGNSFTAVVDPSKQSLDKVKFELKDGNKTLDLTINLTESKDGKFETFFSNGQPAPFEATAKPDIKGVGFLITITIKG